MNVAEVRKSIQRVISGHRRILAEIGASQPKLLELGAITGIAEHYRANGFTVTLLHPRGKRGFIVKTSTRGFPWNFSRIHAAKDKSTVELHMNLMVRGAHDEGIYCVDVGITNAGVVPTEKPDTKWDCLPNPEMITFAEVKKLVVYPMLLAQFIGIVHELKPAFLKKRRKVSGDHPCPILITLGHFSGNSKSIVDAYPKRNISVMIAANYDMRLARIRAAGGGSPFADPPSEEVPLLMPSENRDFE